MSQHRQVHQRGEGGRGWAYASLAAATFVLVVIVAWDTSVRLGRRSIECEGEEPREGFDVGWGAHDKPLDGVTKDGRRARCNAFANRLCDLKGVCGVPGILDEWGNLRVKESLHFADTGMTTLPRDSNGGNPHTLHRAEGSGSGSGDAATLRLTINSGKDESFAVVSRDAQGRPMPRHTMRADGSVLHAGAIHLQGDRMCIGSRCIDEDQLKHIMREPEIGPKGHRGDQGPQGPIGPTGGVGPSGGVGAIGPRGARGAQGRHGTRGAQGPRGPVGPGSVRLAYDTISVSHIGGAYAGNRAGARRFTASPHFSGRVTFTGSGWKGARPYSPALAEIVRVGDGRRMLNLNQRRTGSWSFTHTPGSAGGNVYEVRVRAGGHLHNTSVRYPVSK